jgi:hypothetical protein
MSSTSFFKYAGIALFSVMFIISGACMIIGFYIRGAEECSAAVFGDSFVIGAYWLLIAMSGPGVFGSLIGILLSCDQSNHVLEYYQPWILVSPPALVFVVFSIEFDLQPHKLGCPEFVYHILFLGLVMCLFYLVFSISVFYNSFVKCTKKRGYGVMEEEQV